MSSASRTKDSAIMSAPRRSPQRRSASSFSDRAGTLTATPGRLMPLLLETTPPSMHRGDDVGGGHLDRLQGHLAVVDQQHVARADVTGQPLVRRADPVLVAEDVVHGHDEPGAVLEPDRAVGEPAGADLGTLQVDQDADGVTGLLAGRAHVPVDGLVVGVGAVREVEPGDVHACGDQLAKALRRGDGRAQGADDLGAAHGRDSRARSPTRVTRPTRAGSRASHTVSGRSVGLTGRGSADRPVR